MSLQSMSLFPERGSSTVYDVARRAFEAEIAVHSDAIIHLKGRINSIAPISKLPVEVLSEIFTQVAATHYANYLECRYKMARYAVLPPAYRWITISHVCRSWRNIALGAPRIWGHLILARATTASEEMFKRSKKAPLCVSASIDNAATPRFRLIGSILKESTRLKELRIDGPIRLLLHLAADWSGPANILETLSLGDKNVLHPEPALPSNMVLPTLFSGHTPNLRHLDIYEVVVQWDNPIFCASLTELSITGQRENTFKLGSFSQFLTALRNMP